MIVTVLDVYSDNICTLAKPMNRGDEDIKNEHRSNLFITSSLQWQ